VFAAMEMALIVAAGLGVCMWTCNAPAVVLVILACGNKE